MSANRNVNVNANRNVNVSGGCCYGNYNSGPSWGGVAACVTVGTMVGAAANSAASAPTYAPPPPTYPQGYVTPPPYMNGKPRTAITGDRPPAAVTPRYIDALATAGLARLIAFLDSDDLAKHKVTTRAH
jgi:hypothetical protein